MYQSEANYIAIRTRPPEISADVSNFHILDNTGFECHSINSDDKSEMRRLALDLLDNEQEVYLFSFDWNSRAEAIRCFDRYAADNELSFTWFDSAVLKNSVRDMKKSE